MKLSEDEETRASLLQTRLHQRQKKAPDLQDVFHSFLRNLRSPRAQRSGQAQDLGQRSLPAVLLLHVGAHDLVVDALLVGVVALVDDEQRDV